MRVSPCGYFANSLEEALDLAKQSAEVTHNHPEGIKGAQAIAAAIFLARQHKSKDEIREYIERTFNYNLHRTCDEIRLAYRFDETCQGSCPEAIIAFLDSHDYESAIRLAVSLGGDSDTIACMTGGISAAYYGIPAWIVKYVVTEYLPQNIRDIIGCFDEACTDISMNPVDCSKEVILPKFKFKITSFVHFTQTSPDCFPSRLQSVPCPAVEDSAAP